MSIEQKIAELLEESKKAQEVAATLEEAVGEDEKVEEPIKEDSISDESGIDESKHMSKKKPMKEEDDEDKDEDEDEDDKEEMKKKDDKDEDEEDEKDMEESKKKKMKEETEAEFTVDVSDDVKALLNGEELSEEFQAKAKTIFETVVVSRVKNEDTSYNSAPCNECLTMIKYYNVKRIIFYHENEYFIMNPHDYTTQHQSYGKIYVDKYEHS